MGKLIDEAHSLIGDDPDGPERPPRPTVEEAAADMSPGDLVAARDGDRDVAVFSTANGDIHVVPDFCPHQGAPLSDGYVDGNSIVCALHGWEFDADTGRCAGNDMGLRPRRLNK